MITTLLGILGILATINLLFSFLFIISYSAGKGLYKWLVMDMDFLEFLYTPFLGPTLYVAMRLYERFNWFVVRIVIFFYAVLLLVLLIVFFYLFGTLG
ncbi:hypothetical protein ELQ35_20585 [Peribacillus cavernae]|uniref:Uncharacterized protein n=1 Tax=Peribacillus cavernae TaxID=1674310 RepID=A0A3S0TR88_9BACI|nr:hypothetical protein ELQ35_20585 [Peribacillus cavernae]